MKEVEVNGEQGVGVADVLNRLPDGRTLGSVTTTKN